MKTIKNFKSLWVFSFFILLSCQQGKVDVKAEQEKLMQISRDWSKDVEKRNVQKVVDYWTDDAILLSAGDPEINGKAEIKKMVESSFKDPNFKISWEPISAEVSESGDMGYLLENSTIKMKDSTGTEKVMDFKVVTIWKKQKDGSWKAAVDVMTPKVSK